MSSIQSGTYNPYQSISSYRLYLDVSDGDIEFTSYLKNPYYKNQEINYEIKKKKKKEKNIYYYLSTDENLSFFKTFIDNFNLKDYINGENITLLAPINNNFNILQKTFLNKKVSAINILKNQTFNFRILTTDIKDKIIKLKNKLDDLVLFNGIDYTIEDTQVTNLEHNKNINLIKYIECDNGTLFLIDKPLVPNIF